MKRDSLGIRWLNIAILFLVLLSLMTRVISLSNRPLGNDEAVNALNAAQISPDPATFWPEEEQTPTDSPIYEWATGIVFQLAGTGDSQARFIPALAGTLLALLPLFFLEKSSKVQLILSSFFLALSPVAINLARSASGASLSGLFLTASILLAVFPGSEEYGKRRTLWAVVMFGFALATGNAAFTGVLALMLTYALVRWLHPEALEEAALLKYWRQIGRNLWIAPVVAIVVATGIGGFRFGLSGLGESLVLWLQGWIPFGQLSLPAFLVAGLAYEPFMVPVGILGAVMAWRAGRLRGRIFALWAAASLLVGLAYPGRTAQDLIWISIPLGFLAGEAVAVLLDRLGERQEWLHVVALVGIALALISAAIVTLIGWVNGYLQQMMVGNEILIGLALLSMLLLLSSVFVLFGLGWSWEIVVDGAGIVLVLVAMAMSVSSAWTLANDTGLGFRTLWVTSSPTENGEYFKRTLENASLALLGKPDAAPIQVQGELEPSVVWRLRDYPRYAPLDEQSAAPPPILIAPEGAGLRPYEAEYFGQSFALNMERGWFGLLPPDILRWTLTHSAPTASTGWVIYIRSDIVALTDFPLEAAPPE